MAARALLGAKPRAATFPCPVLKPELRLTPAIEIQKTGSAREYFPGSTCLPSARQARRFEATHEKSSRGNDSQNDERRDFARSQPRWSRQTRISEMHGMGWDRSALRDGRRNPEVV